MVTIGYCLVSVSFLLKFSNPEIIKEQPLYAGRIIVLLGLSTMALFVVSASCIYVYTCDIITDFYSLALELSFVKISKYNKRD